jgi:hypothetical protein
MFIDNKALENVAAKIIEMEIKNIIGLFKSRLIAYCGIRSHA